MDQIAIQLMLPLGVAATFLIGPGVALVFILIRKRRRRAQRRSPIGIDLLRAPGHTVREQLEEATNDLTFDLLTISIIPLLLLAMYLAEAVRRGQAPSGNIFVIYLLGGVGAVGWLAWKMSKAGEKLDRLRAGFDAELAVGQELDKLMREGAWVYHDVPAENFNIDHVVISAKGVFAIETKGYTKPTDLPSKDAMVTYDGRALRFPMWTVTEPVEQAERQAQWLSKWVGSAAAVAVEAVPVIALPGWFVNLTGRGNVRVYNGKQLSTLLRSPRTRGLSADEVQRVVHQIEQRCRTVVPTLRREPN